MQDPAEKARDHALAAGLALLGFLVAFRPIAGMDFPWHLAMGRAYLEHGPLLPADPISHLPMIRPPDMGAWGGEAAFALLDRWGGLTLVRAAVAATVGFVLALVHLSMRRRLGSSALAFLVAAVVASGMTDRMRFRPDVFSVAGVWLLFDALSRAPTRRRDLGLLLLCAVWTQLHPGVVVAPIFALAAWAGHRFRAGFGAVAACAIGASLRPLGPIDLVDLTLETARTGPLVPEWRSVVVQPMATFLDDLALVGAVTALFLVGVLLAWRRRRGRGLMAAILPGLALAMAWRSVRLFYFLGLPAGFGLEALRERIESRTPLRAATFGAAAVLLVAMPLRDRIQAAASARQVGISAFADVYEPNYPVDATRYLERRAFQGRMFHPVKWGGWLGLHLAPRLRTAHDGRITLWGRELAEELATFADPRARPELIEGFDLEIFVLPPGTLGDDEIVHDGERPDERRRFAIVHADPIATVAIDLLGPNAQANVRAARGR